MRAVFLVMKRGARLDGPRIPTVRGGRDPDIRLVFLGMFARRSICAPCLARLVEERLLAITSWLDGKVAADSLVRAEATCLNCDEATTVYRLATIAR